VGNSGDCHDPKDDGRSELLLPDQADAEVATPGDSPQQPVAGVAGSEAARPRINHCGTCQHFRFEACTLGKLTLGADDSCTLWERRQRWLSKFMRGATNQLPLGILVAVLASIIMAQRGWMPTHNSTEIHEIHKSIDATNEKLDAVIGKENNDFHEGQKKSHDENVKKIEERRQ